MTFLSAVKELILFVIPMLVPTCFFSVIFTYLYKHIFLLIFETLMCC